MMSKTVSDESIRFLIAQKMSYVSSAVNICMLWWVSSVAFCAYILAAVWSNREQLRQPGYVMGLGIALFVFFFFIAYFGFMVAYRSVIVQKEIAFLADELNYAYLGDKLKAVKLDTKGGFFYTELVIFKKSMIIGSLSFALIFMGWIVFWILLSAKLAYIYAILSGLWIVAWLSLWCWSHRRILPELGRWVKEIIQPGAS
jgi:hypothetical protein